MRKILLTVALSSLAFACGGDDPPAKAPETVATAPATVAAVVTAAPVEAPPPPKPTMAELQAKGFATYAEAFNAHDAIKLSALYTEDATWRSPGTPDMKGRSQIAAFFSALWGGVPDMKMGPAMVFTKGDISIVQFAVVGTNKDNVGAIKSAGKPVGWQAASVLVWTPEGSIKEERMYVDSGTYLAQIGVYKMKAPGVATLPAKTEMFAANGSDTETKNVDALKGMYGAMEKKNAADFTALMTDTSEWYDNTLPAPSKGKGDAKKFFDKHLVAFPDAKMTPSASWGIGDFVITEAVMTGTNTGPLFGMKATKKAVSINTLDIVAMKDGKMVKGWSFSNGMQAAGQLGLAPKSAAVAPATKSAAVAPATKPDAVAPAKKPAAKK